MEEKSNFDNGPMSKRISIDNCIPIQEGGVTRHTSVIYGTSYLSNKLIFQRNRSSQATIITNIKKDQIFEHVYRFIGHLITDSEFLRNTLTSLYYENDKNISVTRISKSNSQSSNSVNESEISSQAIQSSEIKELQVGKKKEVRKQHKISILVQGSLSQFDSGSFMSSQSALHLSSMQLPHHVLSLELIKEIFEEPEPFLINLSLCLMAKFIFYSKMKLNCENVCWMVSVSTIIAYKIYFDEPVEGLVDSFSGILEISGNDIKNLQRYFLDKIQFQAVITNEQYHTMLSRVLQA